MLLGEYITKVYLERLGNKNFKKLVFYIPAHLIYYIHFTSKLYSQLGTWITTLHRWTLSDRI